MDNIILGWIIPLSQTGITILANLMIQSTIIICIGFFVAFLLRSQGAVVQSLVYRAILGAVILCIPAAMLIEECGLDSLKIVMPFETARESSTVEPGVKEVAYKLLLSATIPADVQTLDKTDTSVEQSAVSVPGAGGIRIADFNPFGNSEISRHIRTWLYVTITLLWIALSVFAVLRLTGYIVSVRWLRRNAINADKSVIDSVWRISNELHVDPPDVMVSPFAKSPFLAGLFCPTILLPEGITVTDGILYHELAHHRRHDCFWNMMSEAACALMPLQPLMILLSRAIEETSDYVSDNYALAFGDEAHSYAVQLASIAAQFQPVPAEAAVGVGFISAKSSLIKRIEHILDESGRFLISVKAHIVAAVVLCALSGAVLTGFVGFKKENLKEAVNIIDVRIVETDDESLTGETIDEAAVSVSKEDITALAPVETPKEDASPVQGNRSEHVQTDIQEKNESASENVDETDLLAFTKTYEKEYSESVDSETVNGIPEKRTASSVSRTSDTMIEETPVRLVETQEKRQVTRVIVQKKETSESEYDRIVRDPEEKRSAKAGNPLAELKLSRSKREITYNKTERFSWEVMLSNKQR